MWAAKLFQLAREGIPATTRLGGLSTLVNRHQRDLGPWVSNLGIRVLSSLPPHTVLNMPALSPTMAQGNLSAWHVKEGDQVTAGDVLADIETDKAVVAFENQEEGIIARLLVTGGTKDIPVGTPVAILVESAEDAAMLKDYVPEGTSQNPHPVAGDIMETQESTVSANKRTSSNILNMKIGPAARKLIAENQLLVEGVAATGPRGIITKGDVLVAIRDHGDKVSEPAGSLQTLRSAPIPKHTGMAPAKPVLDQSTAFMDLPTSQIRKIIANRLQESKRSIPALYVSADAEVDAVSAMRATLKLQGNRVSVNDFVVRAAALALRDVPQANSFWDQAKEEVVQGTAIDISIAVSTESGLITPIVRAAHNKSLLEISAEIQQLVKKAKENKLKPEEFQGGSFSISNLGMFGIDEFAAIINPPQACIMAVGGSHPDVILKEEGAPATQNKITVTISADNRVYDGEIASKFLNTFCSYFSNPIKLLL